MGALWHVLLKKEKKVLTLFWLNNTENTDNLEKSRKYYWEEYANFGKILEILKIYSEDPEKLSWDLQK